MPCISFVQIKIGSRVNSILQSIRYATWNIGYKCCVMGCMKSISNPLLLPALAAFDTVLTPYWLLHATLR